MRLALADVKKRVTHQNGKTLVAPYLLRPKQFQAELETLIQLYESLLRHPYSTFPEERPAEVIGDYRLARCLTNCLMEWYDWRRVEWPGDASAEESVALGAAGITSSSDLRLALYDFANETGGGFVPTAGRDHALDTFAAKVGVSRPTLDSLLRLDEKGEALLERTAPQRPTATDLALRYNQRAVEALLTHASRMEWTLPAPLMGSLGGGTGTTVKRICFLARRIGVHYDVAFAGDVANSSAGRGISIVFYGPPEVTAAPGQYGERLARLARALLGYRRASGTGEAALSMDGLQGAAEVYLYGRPAWFSLDDPLLKLLGVKPAGEEFGPHEDSFDSSLERELHADFTTLSAAGEAHGWRLEREPEPVLVNDVILVPDFALSRGQRRVYLEVAGYWRPGYRERKARKLAALRGYVPIIVAAPEEARAEFASVAADFPFLWYTHHPGAQSLLDLLERDFNDLAERLAGLDTPGLWREVRQRDYIPLRESMVLLHVYTRRELAAALALAGVTSSELDSMPRPRQVLLPERSKSVAETAYSGVWWLEGVGLCSTDWRQQTLARIRDLVTSAPEQRLTVPALCELVQRAQPELAELAAAEVELLAQLAGCTISRTTIFDAEVLGPGVAPALAPPTEPPARMLQTQPRRAVRRKQSRTHYETPSFFPAEPVTEDQ
jgi:predicted nuclease of restriction endonuclease-like RecB superfamily